MNGNIRLGVPVVLQDGTEIGRVDRIVVAPETESLLELVVQKGFLLREDRIVDEGLIERIDEDGRVVLRLDPEQVHDLPPYIAQAYVVAPTYAVARDPYGSAIGPTREDGVLHRTHAPMHEGRHVSSAAYVDWVMSAAAVEVRSDLPETGAAVDVGTDVVTRDGRKIGTIEAIDVDEVRQVRGYVVRSGMFHRLDLVIPEDLIDAVTEDHVRLAVDADHLRFVATEMAAEPIA
ncbi:MAG TPA: PRC-barrel domain-containing protein [Thermomicrobiales bacterium]|nr:PRC-barrel domain-containing protein [Thermomicrobiales bacterium]